jgi:hypothetical protein
VTLFHGRSREWARQQLADRNLHGVKMTASTALVRDTRDPITKLARDLAAQLGVKLGQGRQVGKNTDENVTISAWRQAIAASVIGQQRNWERNPLTVQQELTSMLSRTR